VRGWRAQIGMGWYQWEGVCLTPGSIICRQQYIGGGGDPYCGSQATSSASLNDMASVIILGNDE
jgi:hypothetical protein